MRIRWMTGGMGVVLALGLSVLLLGCGTLELDLPSSGESGSSVSSGGTSGTTGASTGSGGVPTAGPGASSTSTSGSGSGVSVSGSTPSGGLNACGGTSTLTYAGEPAEPLDACGCGGSLACNGTEALRCAGASPRNACGGCGLLSGEIGAQCSVCGGTWRCGAEGDVLCTNAGLPNGCGGCSQLAGAPGRLCGDRDSNKVWTCNGHDSLLCQDPVPGGNACGGEGPLIFAGQRALPGEPCEDPASICGTGVLVCTPDGSSLLCEGLQRNAAGGCGPLLGNPGEACGCGGIWTEDGEGSVRCTGNPRNACGGCTPLDPEPGTLCDGDEVALCVGENEALCLPRSGARNLCGGTADLEPIPGEGCGVCESGYWVCEGPNRLTCIGDQGDAARNPCDGTCTPAEGGVRAGACGTCDAGQLLCSGDDLECDVDSEADVSNECTGCRMLAGEPDSECARCALWTCSEEGEHVLCRVDRTLSGCGEEPLRCADLDPSCASQNRVCDEAIDGREATCSGCLPDFEEVDGACTQRRLGAPCSANRDCVPGAWCPTETRERRCSPRPILDGVQLPFHYVPAGAFTMGSPTEEQGRNRDREAQVSVEISRPLFVQRTPVTQGQWRAVTETWNARDSLNRRMAGWVDATPPFGLTPAYAAAAGVERCTSPQCPVERVSWWDAVVFANALSSIEGLEPCYVLEGCDTESGIGGVGGGCNGTSTFCTDNETFRCIGVTFAGLSCSGYRLPTEAEWEYAARGDTQTATYGGDHVGEERCVLVSGSSSVAPNTPLDALALYNCDQRLRAQPVGERLPNVWGLHDMLGTVHEWTLSRFADAHTGGVDPLGADTGSLRVQRSGSWQSPANEIRAARRARDLPGHRSMATGFRLVRSP